MGMIVSPAQSAKANSCEAKSVFVYNVAKTRDEGKFTALEYNDAITRLAPKMGMERDIKEMHYLVNWVYNSTKSKEWLQQEYLRLCTFEKVS